MSEELFQNLAEKKKHFFARIWEKFKTRECAIATALIIGSIVCALFISEVALRVFFPDPTLTDERLGHVMRPGGDWDADGFRNKRVLEVAGTVIIGDSQTEGNNATREEAWPQQYAELSGETVYQMAVGGYGPVHYLELFKRALEKKPEKIIVGLYLGNDLLDAERMVYNYNAWSYLRANSSRTSTSTENETNYRLILASGERPGSLALRILEARTWIRNNIRIYALLGNATRSFREWIGIARSDEEKQEHIEALAQERPDLVYVYNDQNVGTIMSPSYRIDTVDLDYLKAVEGWRITQEVFRDMKAQADEYSIEFITVVIPTKEMVYMEYLKNTEDKETPGTFTEYIAAETELTNTVRNFCTQIQMRCVFVRDDLAGALQQDIAIYGKTMDGHPVAAGYRIIAEGVYKKIK